MRMNNKRNTMNAIKESKAKKALRTAYAAGMAVNAFAGAMALTSVTAFAGNGDGSEQGDKVISKLVDVMTTIGTYVGMGLIVFGAYEIIMSFLQQQPEAKTKGILMAVCGAVMMGIGGFIGDLGVSGSKKS